MSAYNPQEFSDIITRVYKIKFFKPIYEYLSDPAAFSVFAILLPLVFSFSILGIAITVLIPVVVIALIWLASERWVEKQMSKYEVDDNEYAAYYSEFISIALKKREGAKETVREDYNKEAIKLTRDFLRVVKERWTVGKFKLTNDIFAQPLKEFRLGLQYRVISSLKSKHEKEVAVVKDAIDALQKQCKTLQIANITDFNRSISTLLDTQSNKMGTYKKVTDYLNTHRNLRGVVNLVGILLACAIFAYFSYSYLQIPTEYIYAGTIAIFLALVELVYHKRYEK
jgi:hypothetical protein